MSRRTTDLSSLFGVEWTECYWDDMLLMVEPYGDPVRYIYDEPIILIPECDGARILSNSTMEFLQQVPASTESIFKIGSTEPAALLYDALDHFDRRSAKADENLRLIRSSLPKAVEACVDAAGHEFDPSLQQTLLRDASYGQAFCSEFQRESIQEMSKTLRVLNVVRNPEIGIPLSIQQYKLLTPSVLIGRLVNAHPHLLALNSRYQIIVEHEPLSSKQVPLLLGIGDEDTTLTKSTESALPSSTARKRNQPRSLTACSRQNPSRQNTPNLVSQSPLCHNIVAAEVQNPCSPPEIDSTVVQEKEPS